MSDCVNKSIIIILTLTMNILFICSRNKWRSLTAEAIYKDDKVHKVKSAGTEPGARVRVTYKLINWADIIFVMEKRHKHRLTENFLQFFFACANHGLASVYFLKLSSIACHPPCCISIEFSFSASKLSSTLVLFPSEEKVIFTFLPSSMVYPM